MAKAAKKPAKAKKAEMKIDADAVRGAVREHYGKLAMTGSSCCSTADVSCSCGTIYPEADMVSLPQDAIAVSAGCGNPTAIASLKPGMVVVDLGSGGGIDAFLSARKVGPKGRVFGIDMTPEMIRRARKTASESGIDNVEFRLGEIEHIPLDEGVADVVISNCVINLSPDKPQVFREAFRVLKPGGKLAVSDIVLLSELPKKIRENLGAWSSCVSGAVSEKAYIGAIQEAGFEKVKVEDRVVYKHEQLAAYLSDSDFAGRPELRGRDLSDLIASYRITAVKPKH
jgi:ubiquinone/menaquinone biosynthesis C-methylase UbiE